MRHGSGRLVAGSQRETNMTSNPWGERAAQAETFRRALQPLAARVRAALAAAFGIGWMLGDDD